MGVHASVHGFLCIFKDELVVQNADYPSNLLYVPDC